MSKKISVWILGDQLLRSHPAIEATLAITDKSNIAVVLIASAFGRSKLKYHRNKLVLLLSAM